MATNYVLQLYQVQKMDIIQMYHLQKQITRSKFIFPHLYIMSIAQSLNYGIA